jgi:hypothetical protein
VTLPKRSKFGNFLRQILRKFFITLSVIVEPLRALLRRNALRHASFASPADDPFLSQLPATLLLMVYRAKNVELVQLLVRQVGADADVRLWALDEIAPELADKTIGSGPGTRFANINRLYHAKPIKEGSWVVLADDDTFFIKGSLAETIDIMKRAAFSLAQPSHSVFGWWTSIFNVSRPLLIARDTNYVEQGPLLIADWMFSKEILPFPDDNDMGWGIEAEWYQAKVGRFRSGVIDACRVVHCSRNARTYLAAPEMQRMEERLSKLGIANFWQLQTVNGYWWKWQRSPSWREL